MTTAAAIAPQATAISEKAIALDLLNGAKQAVQLYAQALNETQNQQLRTVLERQLQDALTFQQSVAQFAIQQNYYTPQAQPQQLVQQDLREAMQVYSQAGQMLQTTRLV